MCAAHVPKRCRKRGIRHTTHRNVLKLTSRSHDKNEAGTSSAQGNPFSISRPLGFLNTDYVRCGMVLFFGYYARGILELVCSVSIRRFRN